MPERPEQRASAIAAERAVRGARKAKGVGLRPTPFEDSGVCHPTS